MNRLNLPTQNGWHVSSLRNLVESVWVLNNEGLSENHKQLTHFDKWQGVVAESIPTVLGMRNPIVPAVLELIDTPLICKDGDPKFSYCPLVYSLSVYPYLYSLASARPEVMDYLLSDDRSDVISLYLKLGGLAAPNASDGTFSGTFTGGLDAGNSTLDVAILDPSQGDPTEDLLQLLPKKRRDAVKSALKNNSGYVFKTHTSLATIDPGVLSSLVGMTYQRWGSGRSEVFTTAKDFDSSRLNTALLILLWPWVYSHLEMGTGMLTLVYKDDVLVAAAGFSLVGTGLMYTAFVQSEGKENLSGFGTACLYHSCSRWLELVRSGVTDLGTVMYLTCPSTHVFVDPNFGKFESYKRHLSNAKVEFQAVYGVYSESGKTDCFPPFLDIKNGKLVTGQ